MTTRIVLACGLSELFACSWAIANGHAGRSARNILIIYGQKLSMPTDHRRETLALANRFGDWANVFDLTDEGSSIEWGRLRAPAPVGDELRASLEGAGCIMTHTLWRHPEQAILDLCPTAEITLYDNGLDSHIDRPVVDNADHAAAIRRKDFDRIRTAIYALGDLLPVPAFAQALKPVVPTGASMRAHIGSLAAGLAGDLARLPGPPGAAALVIGTSLYRGGKITREAEADIYRRRISELRRDGLSVVCKEHPRASSPLLDAADGAQIALRTSLPIEFLPLTMDIRLSSSLSSSALLTLKKLFAIPAELLGGERRGALQLPWMARLEAAI
jgi:hypothetical protein